MNHESVRPLLTLEETLEEKVFQRMLEPFDPSQSEGEGGVTMKQESNPEEETSEATQPKSRVAPKQPSPEEVERHMVTLSGNGAPIA